MALCQGSLSGKGRLNLMKNLLYSALNECGLKVQRAAEIGVFSFSSSVLKELINDGVKCDLYEAIPEFCNRIAADIAPYHSAKLFRFALSNFNGQLELCMAGPSTFNAKQTTAPAINHDGLIKSTVEHVKVECRDFREVDPGNYDLVSIDTEGSEFEILSRMTSRPTILAIETQSRDYINPKLGSITDWCVQHGYRVWLWNDTDTIFFRGTPPKVSLTRTIKAGWHNLRYFAGRL